MADAFIPHRWAYDQNAVPVSCEVCGIRYALLPPVLDGPGCPGVSPAPVYAERPARCPMAIRGGSCRLNLGHVGNCEPA